MIYMLSTDSLLLQLSIILIIATNFGVMIYEEINDTVV